MKEKKRLYLANQLGFSETGKILLYKTIVPKLERMFIVYEPFRECKIHMPSVLTNEKKLGNMKYRDVKDISAKFDYDVGCVNNSLMEKSDLMAPILDGCHAVDDGTSSEIGYFHGRCYGPIIALRTDSRMSESINSRVNSQVESYINGSGGKLCFSLNEWFKELRKLLR